MTARVVFSGHATGQITPSKAMVGALRFLPMKTCPLKINNTKSVGQHIYMKARIWNKPIRERRLKVVMLSASSGDIGPNLLSSSDSIKQFYTSINEKNLNKLREFISDNCYFDDCSFIKPFQGKKEVMEFFGQLITSMGQNVKFKIGHMCEGDDFTIGVTWHLEWNKKQIPFTKGCSFYECSMENGTKLVIKRAQVLIESPMKPGGSVLILLKIVTSLFDAFPTATEWFLKSPQGVLQVILRIYNMVLGPFISPFLAWYLNLWKFMAIFLSYTLQTLLFISKIFFK
ncbi:uncharacterized protein LOC114297738 [Camellia sinensis]|uniref:uncharacterized protein LOC114297738 n=1 Tax=Camellia sinensis TaxID=4442 RepID=UPI0010356E29|nr:uncharacterized protein LOC114297738 [Camellia sinensis]